MYCLPAQGAKEPPRDVILKMLNGVLYWRVVLTLPPSLKLSEIEPMGESMRSDQPYVRFHDGAWYVGATGVTAYSVVAMWQQGYSPEEIQGSFPALELREVYGVILYYLEHREEMDAFFHEQKALFHARKAEAEAQNAAFYNEMRDRIARFRATGSTVAS